MSIALTDGDYLGDAWAPVLECISQLARLHLLSSGLQTDDAFFSAPSSDDVANGSRGRRKTNASDAAKAASAAAYKFFYGPSRSEVARQV